LNDDDNDDMMRLSVSVLLLKNVEFDFLKGYSLIFDISFKV
jgi:hypothetical protein